jgi:tRNA(adenine34) deaminase
MEPCPMCFGTMVMMGIRQLHYAAKDSFAGAAELNHKMDYIKSKGIRISKEASELEIFQICLQTAFECIRNHTRMEELLASWSSYCNTGVSLGRKLHKDGYFEAAANENKTIDKIYDDIFYMNLQQRHQDK